jgi:hypothetical protein
MRRKTTDTVQLRLRFSEALRRRIERAADAHDLSLNSEIVRRLEESFRREDQKERIAEAIKHTAEETAKRTVAITVGKPEIRKLIDKLMAEEDARVKSMTEAQYAEFIRQLYGEDK